MKIICLQAENVKRLKAVEIHPDGSLVQITGRNGQGKTSVLDSIWWALDGASNIQAAPIRIGENEARIVLDLGEMKVTRTFRRRGDAQPSTLIVEAANGMRATSPQVLLDSLIGALSFDPLAFTRKKPKEQFDALRHLVPEVDFEAIEAANKADYAARTDVNRAAKDARAAFERIEIPPMLPADAIDESALIKELDAAGEHNKTIETRRAKREQAGADMGRAIGAASEARAKAALLRAEAKELDNAAARHDDTAYQLRVRLSEAGPLPDPIETAAIIARIGEARTTNAAIARRDEREKLQTKAKALEAESEELTNKMDEREAAKVAAIAAAKMPVAGLGFGDNEVTLNGVPFEQASDAEQLSASIAIAMAMNPKLRVIRVRDGSLLDNDAMARLAKLATENDCQVWVEKVDSSGAVGIVIEDGMIAAINATE